MVETVRGADLVLLVTEPTPFGLHDLCLAVQVARDELGLPVGLVINRASVGDAGVDTYCTAENIPILMRIPLDRRIAEARIDRGTVAAFSGHSLHSHWSPSRLWPRSGPRSEPGAFQIN
ncbi:MAG: hypothetical protein R6W83_00950 [Cryobacterium sp.]